MSNYTKVTNFGSKDALPAGNAAKVVKGTEIDGEFSAIQTVISTKADINTPAFSGVPTAPTIGTDGSDSTTAVATTAFVQSAIAGSGDQDTNGYETFPSGTIMQWGRESIGGETSVTVTFPEPFTSDCYSFTCSSYQSGDTNGADRVEIISTLPTATSCVVSTNSGHTSILWWAVGK